MKFLAAVAFLLMAEMLFSCSSALDENAYFFKTSDKGLSIIINNFNSSSEDNLSSSSRIIIAPSTCTLDGVAKFVIEGVDTANPSNTIRQEIAISSSGVGTISDITKSFWMFTLHAYADEAMTKEILQGSASVDTNQNASVSFTLSSQGLTTAGSCAITLAYDSNYGSVFTEMVGEIHAYLCDAISLEVVKDIVSISSAADLASFVNGSGYLVEENSLNPGAYILTMAFYNIANSTAKKIGFFSAGFIVEPGRCTSQTVTVPHIIATKPAAPKNLVVYRDDSTLTPDSYNAVIRWDDESNNEEYFQLIIREYDSDSATTGSRTVMDYSNYSTKTFASDGIGFIDGSLNYSSEEIVLKLGTGKLYDFELYAVNTYGSSAACSRSLSSDISEDSEYGALTGFAAPGDSAPYKRVNTFVISYVLENGTLVTSLGNAYTGQRYIEYKIYNGSSTALIIPADIVDPSDSAYSNQTEWPVCYYGNLSQAWSKWVESGSPTTAVTSVSTFTNRTFHAVYNVTTSTDLYFDNAKMYVTYGSTPSESVYGNSGAITLSSGASVSTGYVTITIDRSSEPNSTFTRFNFYVNGTLQSYDTSGAGTTAISYTIPLLLKGSYSIQVSAAYNEQYFYSNDFELTVN